MNIKPLYDRVVIKRMEEEKMSAGGIVIPDSATEKPIKGEVIAIPAFGDAEVATGRMLPQVSMRPIDTSPCIPAIAGWSFCAPWVR